MKDNTAKDKKLSDDHYFAQLGADEKKELIAAAEKNRKIEEILTTDPEMNRLNKGIKYGEEKDIDSILLRFLGINYKKYRTNLRFLAFIRIFFLIILFSFPSFLNPSYSINIFTVYYLSFIIISYCFLEFLSYRYKMQKVDRASAFLNDELDKLLEE
jgi:hypothetical protein